ncbi:MAG TPA: hypothetical protein VI776_01095 [Anaerolineales bacterium]|nr:hypothetical protein [Anaerolineales bacterium]
MPARKDAWFLIAVGGGFIAVMMLPTLWAFSASGPETVYGGFLFNPIDGYSYLAKMQAGYQGAWRYSLPYTLEDGGGAYLFLYYILLGHLARLLALPPVSVFHLARLAGAALMILALWRFFSTIFLEPAWRRLAFALALFAAGLGWLGVTVGILTADLWVAEAYPFLSAYANPHFPLGLALLAWLLTPFPAKITTGNRAWTGWKGVLTLLAGLALAIVLPFGLVVVLAVLAGLAVWDIFQPNGLLREDWTAGQKPGNRLARSREFRRLLLVLAGGVMVLVYDQWVIASDPFFRGWNAQNLTLTPPWWDVALSFAPVLLLAIPGGWQAARSKRPERRVLLVWAVLGLLLVYLPFGLQRRFFTGLMIPLAGLAALGIQLLSTKIGGRRTFLVAALLFLLALPTTLVNLLVGAYGIQTRDPLLFVRADERRAFEWLAEHTPGGAGVLAGPETGLQLPAFSGRRVVYGHPFETVAAAGQKALVERLFGGIYRPEELQVLSRVDYVYYGPRERLLGSPAFLQGLQLAWRSGEVEIYRTTGSQPP